MKIITKMNKIFLSAILIITIGMVSLPVSAYEKNIIKNPEKVITGFLEDGTPYTISIISSDVSTNIVDSRYYYFKATFAWGTKAPETMKVSIPIDGSIYKGTLKRIGKQTNDKLALEVYAYYGGTIIASI